MIDFFRKLNPIGLIILVAIAVFLRLGIFLQLPETLEFTFWENYVGTLFHVSLDSLFDPSANVFSAMVITLVEAVIFNRIVNHYNLLGKPSFLPALMYVTASSMLLPFVTLSPALLCNFLMLWLISKFLSIYRKTEARSVMFDSGMIIAVGTLLYFPFIGMVPVMWIALSVFRPFNWREWVAGLVGFFTIYFFLGVIYYLNDSFEKFYHLKVPLAAQFPNLLQVNFYDFIVLVPIILILVLSVISLQQKMNRSGVHVRKSYLILFVTAIFSLLSFFIKPDYQVYHFLLAVPPLAVFMANYFMNASKRWFYESLYLLLLAFIVYFQFF